MKKSSFQNKFQNSDIIKNSLIWEEVNEKPFRFIIRNCYFRGNPYFNFVFNCKKLSF